MKTGAGASLLFISPLGVHLRYIICLHFAASNNAAEYEALVNGLRIAIELGVRRLVYGGEAILPTDIEHVSLRLRAYNEHNNQINREDSLDQQEEARDVALIHSARYQQSLRSYHARRVRPRGFPEGDMVLRLRQDNRGRHKLTPS
jgi:ribonuclease HI